MSKAGLKWTLCASVMFVVGCGSSVSIQTPTNPGGERPAEQDPTARDRYAFHNQCWVLRSAATGAYLQRNANGYQAVSTTLADGEKFYFKPSRLGEYLLMDGSGALVRAGNPATARPLASADDQSRFTLKVVGDTTVYPVGPAVFEEPTPALLTAFRGFNDPRVQGTRHRLTRFSDDQPLGLNAAGRLGLASVDADHEQFEILAANDCAEFPEARDNTVGETFRGTTADGKVLGMADVHVHISATEFLGGAQWGDPFHPLGVTHALGNCVVDHGPQGALDAVGALLGNQFTGHSTDGWPTFTSWPARNMLTHEAIYWKWLERAWKAGLRIAVNDVVDNETLCKLQRNITATPFTDCNETNNATRQVGTMYAMQAYIDAQYGGPGEGWFRVVLDPAEARQVIEDGKLAVVLGIEISNLFDCKLTYNPLRQQEPFEETGTGLLENRYSCRMTETGADDEILTQMDRLWDLGIRQIISIHEFDNAFGGNGIFDALVLNIGNRENTGGIPDLADVTTLTDIGTLTGVLAVPDGISPLGNLPLLGEAATGEFWTTYDCPTVEDPSVGGGFFSDARAGTVMTGLPQGCLFLGQGGRPGGPLPCYPAAPQCNARWMTPIGLYTYRKLMERGWIIDVDHLEFEMKNQLLELAEAQPVTYPLVSTHGTFGGMSNAQAIRILQGGGYIFPSLGNGPSHLNLLDELKGLWTTAGQPFEFGFGFGTDTNGLSTQAPPRSQIEAGKAISYPFTLFSEPNFAPLSEFESARSLRFEQPEERDAQGRGRTWNQDLDGNAHYGMLADTVQEMQIEGNPQQLRDVYHSAEVYLQTWERTVAARNAIAATGETAVPPGLLRAAPRPASPVKVD